MEFEVERMEPLFKDQAEYDAFLDRHSNNHVTTGDIASYKGDCYLGIDAGSTTTKVALVGEDGSLLYSFTATTTEARSRPVSVRSRRSTVFFLRTRISCTPVLPVTARL